MVLRLIQPRTMRQSGEQLFSVNSAVILALCISPLILRSATPSCCSLRFDTIWGERAIHARRRPCEVFVCLQLKGRRNTQFLAVRPRDKTLQVFRSRYFTDWPHFSFMPSLGSLQPLERWGGGVRKLWLLTSRNRPAGWEDKMRPEWWRGEGGQTALRGFWLKQRLTRQQKQTFTGHECAPEAFGLSCCSLTFKHVLSVRS